MIYHYSSNMIYKPSVNFNDLRIEMNKNKQIYKNVSGIDKYIDRWFNVLQQTYLNEKNIQFNIISPENYYKEITFLNSELRIHFDISKAKDLALEYDTQIIPLSAFSEYDDGKATIKYDSVSLNSTYRLAKTPIITIPFNFSGLYYLTIDGNHRITKYKELHKETINAVLLELPDIIKIIKSNFEKAVYLFLFEGMDIHNYIHNSATQYYHNGIFIFD